MRTHGSMTLTTLLLVLLGASACSSTKSNTSGANGGAGNSGGAAGANAAGNGGGAGNGGAAAGSGAAGSGSAGAGNAGSGGADAAGSGGAGSVVGDGPMMRQATQQNGLYFPANSAWSTDVHDTTQFPKASDSDAITAWMVSHGGDGWGGKDHVFQIDFSLMAVEVPAGTMKRTFQTGDTGFHADPDCDMVSVPVPNNGAVEGTEGMNSDLTNPLRGYQCSGFAAGDDCHMLFVSRSEHRLYELYHSTIDAGGAFYAGCLALWDTSKVYDDHGRGDQCTSADAAGFPIAPLLFTAEEVKAGEIKHAIRFVLPNDMIRTKKYVPPATHGTNTTGPMTSMPYGAHLRLKTPYAGMANLSSAAQVVARALQTYGMYMADGGNVPLLGQNDTLGTVKWSDVGLDSHSLYGIKASDFEVLAYPTPIDVTYDCKRTAVTE